jgi:glutathione S-transferase
MDDINLAASSVPDFNVFGWPYTGLVTLLTLVIYIGMAIMVSRIRRKTNTPVPGMDGPPEFLRAFRIHQNTAEQLILFIPLLWIAALSSHDEVAAGIGMLWPVSRIIYARGYMKDPAKRLPGFVMGIAVLLVLLILSAVQLVRSLIAWQ